jgi:hypothetical protein
MRILSCWQQRPGGNEDFHDMINKTNGHLSISSEIELAPNDSFQKIDNLKLGETQETQDMKNGYKWLTTKNVKINQEYFILSFCFFNDAFVMLSFVFDDKKFALNSSWDNWSEEKEQSNEHKFKNWVDDKLGHQGPFPWGEV